MAGAKTCRSHGSANKVSREKAKRVLAQARVEGQIAKLLQECDMPAQHPLDGILEVVRHTGAMMRMLAGLVGELAVHPDEGEESWSMNELGELIIRKEGSLYGPNHFGDATSSVLVDMYGLWSDRYARACKLALDANIDERLVRNAEATSDALFSALSVALNAAGLTAEQQLKLRNTLATELRRHTGMLT